MREAGNLGRRWPRRFGKIILALAGAIAVVEIFAALRVRQLRPSGRLARKSFILIKNAVKTPRKEAT